MVKLRTKLCLGINIVDTDYETFINNTIKSKDQFNPINIMSINLTALKRYNMEFQLFVDRFDYITADGKGLVLFSRFLGEKIYNHLSIPVICDKYIENYVQKNKKVFLLGATKKVNKKAMENLKLKFPTIQISGYHGYFNVEKMNHVLKAIIKFQPELVLVGISSPMKERVILKISEGYNNSINVACGGYIDIVSGKTGKAPKLFHQTGMEWLYRFYQEPKRMFVPMFINAFFSIFYILPIALVKKYFSKESPQVLEIMDRYNNR